ncbi:nuclear transport factor 2 family protein [Lysinibacillus sp. NPDC093190]|uniref:nuclear transport factor 2 family protein n=1 Tax=Lysinibacillus sp. NPDC093190 TaxID=3390575 RepID=UPI003CFD272E
MLKKSFLAVLTLLMLTALMLTACGNKKDEMSAEEKQKIIDDGTVGFEMNGGKITKAENIPADEEKAIIAAFNEYIAAFNSNEIDRYMQTISKNPKGFNYEEDKKYTSEVFKQSDVKRDAKDTTIIKYNANEAQVHSNLTVHLVQTKTNVKHESAGQQVTVFVKEDGRWKVTSVFYMDDTKSSTGK